MKIQWVGSGQQSKNPLFKNDNFGLSNFHRLKFRTTSENLLSKGDSRRLPTIAVFCAGDPSSPEPEQASRFIVKKLINDFRHEGRSQILDIDLLEKWLRFKISDLRSSMLNSAQETVFLKGYTSSLSILIFTGKRAIFAQLGDTVCYHIRKGLTHCPSAGDLQGILADPEQHPAFNLPTDGKKPFTEQTIASLKIKDEELAPLICSLEATRGDVFFLTTKGVGQIFRPEKFNEIIGNPRNTKALESVIERVTQRAAELSPKTAVGGLMIRLK